MIFCSKPSKSVQFRWFFQNFIKHFVDFANLKIFKKKQAGETTSEMMDGEGEDTLEPELEKI